MPVIPSRGAELLEIQFEKLRSSDTKSRPPSQALRKPYPRVAEQVPEHLRPSDLPRPRLEFPLRDYGNFTQPLIARYELPQRQ